MLLSVNRQQTCARLLSPEPCGFARWQVVYELRIYSMEAGSFGTVVRSRQVKAPHCITSIQFSPTSEHLLVAYGRFVLALHQL